ncbi:CocE/NonD family hydrolase [Kitasatospora sp. SUK 42]|uniref:CocE/NonD family hydrolase n=1 Tax=Kitasatospora sp. SUK 42 TaxID=1588882 RepID=UPI001C314AB4|nr:CocE/NonD family hydrolase [Kitasatospora sp. SUK 42]MBV2153396.1 CocE/NonD family hydrolase [Kitasatospora sp. SUK 42]
MPSYPFHTTREDVRIPLPDGTELAARLWRPVTEGAIPTLLEYSADRLGDRTAAEDARRHPWYAGHGYAAVRVDTRGHGDSGGAPAEPGSERELSDGAAVVQWLTRRPWCNGRLGLLGVGAAGTTALRLAARVPETVGAVVTACPEGGHRLGGAVLAADLHTRLTDLVANAALPPDPRRLGDAWRAGWLARLESLEPPVDTWLAAGDTTVPVSVPVLAVAGWGDPSCSFVLRLLAESPTAHALIGPWPHGLPEAALTETLRWWDHWLRGVDTGALKEPALRSWISTRWTGEEAWPSPDVREIHYDLDGQLSTAGTASDDRYVHVRSPQHTGLNAGSYVPHGRPADRPPDQREEDGRSVCFDSQPLPEPVELLGAPTLRLRLREGGAPAQVVARLCVVGPEGASELLSRGVLDVGGAGGGVGEGGAEVEVELAACAATVPAGHRLRLALSSVYWPWVWPPADDTGYAVDPSRSTLGLPVRHLAADIGTAPITFGTPSLPDLLDIHVTEPLTARPEHVTVHDIGRHEWRTELSPAGDGTRTHPDGLVRDEHTVTAYRVLTGAPLSAQARSDRTVRLERPDIGWDVTVQTRTQLRCDAGHFISVVQLRALEAGSVVFTREWQHRVPRERP